MSYEGELVARYDAIHKRLIDAHPLVKKTPPLVPQPPISKTSLEVVLLRLEHIEEQVKWLELAKADKPKNDPHYPQPQFLSVDDVFQLVVKVEQYQSCLVRSNQRSADLCLVRHIVYYLAATQTKKSMSQIARYMGKDHTTIMHGRRKIAAQRLKDPQLNSRLVWYEKEIARLTEAKNKP